MDTINGYLFAKLSNIGTRSEGSEYYLQKQDYQEMPVIKQVNLWENDPALHPLLGQKVVISGQQSDEGIAYQRVLTEDQSRGALNENKLLVRVKLEQDTFWLDKSPKSKLSEQVMHLTQAVLWPYRSIWEGECPSSQLYDFWIEYQGKTIWRWSDHQAFLEVVTPIEIPGGSEIEASEAWTIDANSIHEEGLYTAKTLHIASGEEASMGFNIRFTNPN